MKRKKYVVLWECVFWDTSPTGAAQQAFAYLRDKGTRDYPNPAMRFLVAALASDRSPPMKNPVFVDLMRAVPRVIKAVSTRK